MDDEPAVQRALAMARAVGRRWRMLLIGVSIVVAAIPWIHVRGLDRVKVSFEPWPAHDLIHGSVMLGMLVAVIALQRAWWRLPTLPTWLRVGLPVACALLGLVIGAYLMPVVGGFVGLGLCAQLMAGIIWSERCHAIRPVARWARPVWALLGAFAPISILAGNIMPFSVLETLRSAQQIQPVNSAIWLVAIVHLIYVAGHHLRTRHRAQNLLVNRSIDEPETDWSEARGEGGE